VGDDHLPGDYIRFLHTHMEDAVFLKAGAGTDANLSEVAPQDGPGTDKTLLPDGHIPDKGGLGVDIGRGVDDRKFVFKGIEGHDNKKRFKV
jgi:hypothetical protein